MAVHQEEKKEKAVICLPEEMHLIVKRRLLYIAEAVADTLS